MEDIVATDGHPLPVRMRRSDWKHTDAMDGTEAIVVLPRATRAITRPRIRLVATQLHVSPGLRHFHRPARQGPAVF